MIVLTPPSYEPIIWSKVKNKYCVWEIAEDLHMTNNAVYKRIEKFSKKCKKRG